MCKKVFAIIWLVVLCLAGNAREVVNINRNWTFCAGDTVYAKWRKVNLPHDFQIHQPWIKPSPDELPDMDNPVANIKSRLSARGFKEMGTGWYRHELVANPKWKGKRILIDFEGILLVGDVWFNGLPVGKIDYGYLGMEIDITDRIRFGGKNEILVRADTGSPLNSRWYTGAGIYRDVNIVITDTLLYMERHPLQITTPVVSESLAMVAVNICAASSLPKKSKIGIRLCIYGPDGKIVYDKNKAFTTVRRSDEYALDTLTIDNPCLWSCESPYLYTAEVSLIGLKGHVTDSVRQRFGIRNIEYSSAYGLRLNGKKVLLKGIANHHTLGALGAAAFPDAMRKRIKLLKEFGFNHIRTSHNPYSESLLDLCDEYGILVVDEIYDKWLTQYTGGRRSWEDCWQYDIPEWVKRDRNHPCVVMWSLGNELQTLWEIPYHDYGVTPYRMQKALLKRYDDTRPVTVAMHPRGRDHRTDSLPAPLALETDIAAYNYRYMYFAGDSRRFPGMVFYQSEASVSRLGKNWFGMDLEKVTGLAYWGAIDYLGESQGWPVKGWNKGVFDISLNPKPQAWFIRSYFKPDEPVVHIGIVESEDNTLWNDVDVGIRRLVDHWNFQSGAKLSMYTYTNADEVELLVNGKTIGRKMNDRGNVEYRNAIYWKNVSYEPGTIEAIAYTDGSKVAEYKIETSGIPVRLDVTVDEGMEVWKNDGQSLRHISVKAVDSKGRLVPYVTDSLTFSVDGPAEIAGVINGDLASEELTVGNSRRLYGGRASVVLRSTLEQGTVTLTVMSSNFKPIKVRLRK